MTTRKWSAAKLLNALQTGFISLLRLWSIPIVLMLSLASGYTTYFGMSRFITDWIALVITIAVQSIIVIATLEVATIRWQANRLRYFMISLSLLVSLCVSVSFSYFKFYEISQAQSIRIENLLGFQKTLDDYIDTIYDTKRKLVAEQRSKLAKVEREVSLAYMGKHPDMAPDYKNRVGKGAFWRHFNEIAQTEKQRLVDLETVFVSLDSSLGEMRQVARGFDLNSDNSEMAYASVMTQFSKVQNQFNEVVSRQGHEAVKSPVIPPYEQLVQAINPSIAMWQGFSLFAFICAAMVDFFTVILSYRLEANAPGTLDENEQQLAYHCIRQFSEFRINPNDELEVVIEKSDVERARRYPDWMRLFGAAFLLNKGYLRKVNKKTVEFAPNLYPVIAKVMNDQASKPNQTNSTDTEEEGEKQESFDQIVKRMFRG